MNDNRKMALVIVVLLILALPTILSLLGFAISVVKKVAIIGFIALIIIGIFLIIKKMKSGRENEK